MEREQSIWIIVPAYNEAHALAVPLQALCEQYQHVVVVNDGSTDETAAVASRFPVYLLNHLFNLGQGAALRTGMDFALQQGSQTLVTFDADGQHSEEDVAAVARPVQQGEVDVALGSRFLGSAEGIPTSRRILLKLAVAFTRIFSRLRVTDTHNGLRAFSRTAATRIRITEDGMAHASEILDEVQRQKLRYCEVPVRVHYSPESIGKGQSNWQAVKIGCQFLFGRLLR
ncbi:MAG: glycosyltransferase family 2 protein [Pirellulales bacterium]